MYRVFLMYMLDLGTEFLMNWFLFRNRESVLSSWLRVSNYVAHWFATTHTKPPPNHSINLANGSVSLKPLKQVLKQ